MKKIDVQLPAWIATHASLGDHVDLNDGIEYEANERFWYWLTLFCPIIFESYSVALHPFWIKTLKEETQTIAKHIQEFDYSPITWPRFFKLYNEKFKLKDAVVVKEKLRLQLLEGKWPEHISFPEEGDMENCQILQIRDVLLNIYGDIEVNYYYVILKTQNWETDITYRGKLSELESLWILDDVRDNPSAIYADNKEWCIVTNYDCDATYIGGSEDLVKKLTSIDGYDIYPIEPKSAN